MPLPSVPIQSVQLAVQLVLPGLLWPRQILPEATAKLDLPALSWLLGRARRQWLPAQSLEACLCECFGVDGQPVEKFTEYPLGALRRYGESAALPEENDFWLCADPVHLSVEKRRITLPAQTHPASDEEMQAIATAFRQYFSDIGSDSPDFHEFHPAPLGRGYLRLKHFPAMTTTPPSAAASVDAMLPRGPDAPRWRRLANEMQMVLHTLPFNEERERQGRPPLNALWLWGAGPLPPKPEKSPFTAVHGNHALLTGLARRAGESASCPGNAQTLLAQTGGSHLLLIDTLQQAARQYDLLQWREMLIKTEREWLQPLRHALITGRLKRLKISAPGDETRLDLDLTQISARAFWRRPRSLAEIHP